MLKRRTKAKVFYCNKCNAISENYSEKNFCLLTCLKLPPPVSQFIFLATVRKMNWKRCIFPASQIVAQFIMASIMWKVPQYYWIVSAYTSNTFFFVTHSGEYKDSVCFRFFTENSTTNWPWHLWTLNIRVWKKYYENPLFWCSLQMRHSLVIFQQSTITTAVKL